MSTKTNGVRFNDLVDGIPDGFELPEDGDDLFDFYELPENSAHPVSPVSQTRTAYAVRCWRDGQVYLTADEYLRQMNRPDSKWECPICRELASFDDQNYDEIMEQEYEAYLDTESKNKQQ